MLLSALDVPRLSGPELPLKAGSRIAWSNLEVCPFGNIPALKLRRDRRGVAFDIANARIFGGESLRIKPQPRLAM